MRATLKHRLPVPLWNGLGILYGKTVSFSEEAKWRFAFKRLQSRKRIKALKDKHHGERCFIIGNGPSLNKMDLSRLANEITIGTNRIYLLFDRVRFSTTYYVAVNRLVIEQCAGEVAKITCPKFLSWHSRDAISFTPTTMFLRSRGRPEFHRDINHGIWEGSTVTFVAMQVAHYLGFHRVILIGVDHSFRTQGKPHATVISSGDDIDHFDKNYFGKGFRWNLPDLETSEVAYKIAKQEFEHDGREILDATVEGRLQVFRKVNFETLFS